MVYLNSDLRDKKYFQFYALSLNDYFTPPHSLRVPHWCYWNQMYIFDDRIPKICIKGFDTNGSGHWRETLSSQLSTLWLCRNKHFIVVQLLNCVRFFATPWTTKYQSPSLLHCLSEFTQIYVHWVCDWPTACIFQTHIQFLFFVWLHVGYVFGTKLECWYTNMEKVKHVLSFSLSL